MARLSESAGERERAVAVVRMRLHLHDQVFDGDGIRCALEEIRLQKFASLPTEGVCGLVEPVDSLRELSRPRRRDTRREKAFGAGGLYCSR
jgi:hypothetical protein